jgi:hypothetical protein
MGFMTWKRWGLLLKTPLLADLLRMDLETLILASTKKSSVDRR